MLGALEIIAIGLHTPEACVISAASFEVREAQSQNSQVTLSPAGVSHHANRTNNH